MPDVAEKEADDWLSVLGRKLFGEGTKERKEAPKERMTKPPVFPYEPPTAIQQEPPSREYPSSAEVETSKAVEQYYGSPFETYFKPGMASVRVMQHKDAEAIMDATGKRLTAKSGRMVETDPETADRLHANWLASERSAVAKMGFDPSTAIETRSKTPFTRYSGGFEPSTDTMFYDARRPDAMIHESIHRGLRKLEKEGLMPDVVLPALGKIGEKRNTDYHEMLTRALMVRHFGEIEVGRGSIGDQRVVDAKRIVPEEHLDAVEEAAQKYLAKKHPGGPR